ncbi:hypothetical protein [Aquimarina aquimarini]|uniref:hypothetical protein n=1 Tax=Aquimarina aquimarini TaxID=1191734 RepID=UPI000D55AFC9|nr:hypothetical protein [Aquimarina aquimarini]
MIGIKRNHIEIIGVIIVLLISVFLWNSRKNEIEEISKNSLPTVAIIIKHEVIGIGDGYYVTYRYNVGDREYIKTDNYSRKFATCYKDSSCIGLKFRLYYNINDPEKCVINFNQEILE